MEVALIESATEWMCVAGEGGPYVQLAVVYNGIGPLGAIEVTSLTSGVSFTITSPPPPYPINPGIPVVFDIEFTGLAVGTSAQLLISMFGPEDQFGVAPSYGDRTETVIRPGGLDFPVSAYCPNVIYGEVRQRQKENMSPDFPKAGWTITVRVRHPSSDSDEVQTRQTQTNDAGIYAVEGLLGANSVFEIFVKKSTIFDRWGMYEPKDGFFGRRFEMGKLSMELNFVMDDQTSTGTEIDRLSEEVPVEYSLEVNYPNPFNPSTRIEYALPEVEHVRLDVFDVLGHLVATLIDSVPPPAQYGVTFDAGRLPSGVYMYRMTAGSFVQTNRMLLVK